MRTLKLRYPVLLLCCGFFTVSTFGQCHNASFDAGSSVSGVKAQSEERDRTILLTLVLRKSGTVREAKVLKGPTELIGPAIQAAKHRKYKDAINAWPFSNEIMVEVTFRKDMDVAPEIRQALPGDVPGCVYVSRVRVSPGVMQTRLLALNPAIQQELRRLAYSSFDSTLTKRETYRVWKRSADRMRSPLLPSMWSRDGNIDRMS